MSIRPIDSNIIMPRTIDLARDSAIAANKPNVAQQFSVQMTDEVMKHRQEMTTEILESKNSDEVDEDGHGESWSGQQNPGKEKHKKKEPDEFSLTSMMIDIRI